MLLYNCIGWVLDRTPHTKETLSDFFVKSWIPVNGTREGVSSYTISTSFYGLMGDQRTPRF